jgi:carbamoyltransferase
MRMNEALESPTRCRRGETLYLLVIGPAGHDSGVAVVEASQQTGGSLICNKEQKRYRGVRHCTEYCSQSLAALTASDGSALRRR